MGNSQLTSSNVDSNYAGQDVRLFLYGPERKPSSEGGNDLGRPAEPGPTTDFSTNSGQASELTNRGFQIHNTVDADQTSSNLVLNDLSRNPIHLPSNDVSSLVTNQFSLPPAVSEPGLPHNPPAPTQFNSINQTFSTFILDNLGQNPVHLSSNSVGLLPPAVPGSGFLHNPLALTPSRGADQASSDLVLNDIGQDPVPSFPNDVGSFPPVVSEPGFLHNPPAPTLFNGAATTFPPFVSLTTSIFAPQTLVTPQQLGPDSQPERSTDVPPQKNRRKPSKTHSCAAVMRKYGNTPTPGCEFADANLRLVGKHINDEHEVKAFKCCNCDYKSDRKDNLKTHKKACRGPTSGTIAPPTSIDTPTNERPAKRSRVVSDTHAVLSGSQPQSPTTLPRHLASNSPSFPQSRRPMLQPQSWLPVFQEPNVDIHHTIIKTERTKKIGVLLSQYKEATQHVAYWEKCRNDIVLQLAELHVEERTYYA